MDNGWNAILWHQFGAVLDMLDDILHACPDELWREPLWEVPDDSPQYGEVWFIIYHTIYWADLYLHGAVEGFTPPQFVQRYEKAPDGILPVTPYTRADLHAYLQACRRKCHDTFENITAELAAKPCHFGWINGEMTYLELQLYNMRHVQEHVAQLNLMLGQKTASAPDWVARARQHTFTLE